MNYYKIAPLRLNLPALIYKSPLALPKNSVVKICVKNKSALGIVLDSAKKPNFECEWATQSEFYLTPNQAVLGKFIASYYCVNEGVALGIMTLGKSSNSSSLTQSSWELEKSSLDGLKSYLRADFPAQPTNLAQDTRIALANDAKTAESTLDSANQKNPSLRANPQDLRGNPPCKNTQNLQSGLPRSHSLARNDEILDSSLRKYSAQNDNLRLDSAKSQNLGENISSLRNFAKQSCGKPPIEKIQDSQSGWLLCNARKSFGLPREQSSLAMTENNNFAESALDSAILLHEANSSIFDEKSGLCSCEREDRTNGSSTKRATNLPDLSQKDDEFAQNLPKLSQPQQRALDFILSHDKTLLFGDTGSGKTEIYINAIAHTITQGKNVIFLMPEISLTPQMERRLKGVFGDFVCIWHSKITKAKKEQILARLDSAPYHKNAESNADSANFVRDSAKFPLDSAIFTQNNHSAKNQIKIIAGARSALFLPLSNIGLIIIDEEHDDAYKSNSSPRYNARDLAIFLAHKERVRLILGSATPSVNSYYNFSKENCVFRLRGGYFQGKKSVSFDSEILSLNLLEKIRTALENKAQSIIFVPLRGNFKVLQCESCGNGAKCKHCSINMSLHSKRNALICHYCGYAEPFFEGKTKCKTCNSTAFKALKLGTQEICKQLQSHFTHAKIAIFDRDEVKSDSKMRKILSEFNDGKIDILVGTQMISKGHDYHNVALVAILGIDGILNSSDFRAYERAVGLLTQISGRTARKNDGEVVINTRNRAFFMPFLSDYEEFLRFELKNRENLYPPFRRIALLIAQNRDESRAKEILQNAKKIVESAHKNIEIIGLNKAPIERINGLWRYFMLLRAKSAKELVCAVASCKNLPLIIDIDPQQVF